jgi:hypothetical protein
LKSDEAEMTKEKRIPFMIYVIESIAALSLGLFGLYYLITQLFGAPGESSLLLVIPTAVILIPAVILGLYMAYRRNYSKQVIISFTEAGSNINGSRVLILSVLIVIVAAASLEYAFVYIHYRQDYLIGILLAIVGVVASIMLLPFMKKAIGVMGKYFDKNKGSKH